MRKLGGAVGIITVGKVSVRSLLKVCLKVEFSLDPTLFTFSSLNCETSNFSFY